ncbi:MAG TPA: DsbA family protein [Candidatus Binataceae bacterium]|jgi:2-hydroxychromene-2-carboxylate isomerase|nr:DsbA family protein [Candidatus Binataceae bacterium]
MSQATEIIRFYYDYKSPFTYLAFDPAIDLERTHRVQLTFVPHVFDFRAYGGELPARTNRDWFKVRYLYADARRFANERGLIIRGPQKLFDSRLALISGIFADRAGNFRQYSRTVFERFFKRELDLESLDALARLIEECGMDAAGFRHFAAREGETALAEALAQGERDGVFGVPTLIVDGEPFWGNDRIAWVVKKLDRMGLRR